MPECDFSAASRRAEELRSAIASTPMYTPKGVVSVTVSMGVTVGGGAIPTDAESLLRTSDEALYQAKNAGRNRVVVCEIDEDRLPPRAKTRALKDFCAKHSRGEKQPICA